MFFCIWFQSKAYFAVGILMFVSLFVIVSVSDGDYVTKMYVIFNTNFKFNKKKDA